MHRDEHGRQQGGLTPDDGASEGERGQDQERAEGRRDEPAGHLPVADQRLGECDADRIQRVKQRIERRARGLDLLGDRHVDDAVGLDDRQELGDEHPDAERQHGHGQRQDHTLPRAIVS
jgi:hypothetical protein